MFKKSIPQHFVVEGSSMVNDAGFCNTEQPFPQHPFRWCKNARCACLTTVVKCYLSINAVTFVTGRMICSDRNLHRKCAYIGSRNPAKSGQNALGAGTRFARKWSDSAGSLTCQRCSQN